MEGNHTGYKKRKKRKRAAVIGFRVVMVLIICLLSAAVIQKMYTADKSKKVKSKADEYSVPKVEDKTASGPIKGGWNLTLVNPWNSLPGGYEPELTALPGGHNVDSRCAEALEEMLADCEKEGLSPLICSSYRKWDKQIKLYNDQVRMCESQGFAGEEAKKEAGKTVAVPGTSEHQLGLAVDIVDASYQLLDTNQENTKVQQWLMENSWKYGFILRFPTDKSQITGIIYEPWHYRYVGKETAEQIYKAGITLEEYLKQ